jgi:CBS domain containing-hemolysin-like protein
VSTGTALLIGALLLIANAFFVGAEFAIISARRSQIEPLAANGSRAARTVLWAMERVSLMLACAQLGITICSTGIGVVAEPAIAHAVEGPLVAMGLPAEASHVVGFTIALGIVVYLHVVIGEMVPKNLALSRPERAAVLFGPPLVVVSRVVSPLIRLLNWLANGVLRALGVQPKDEVTSAFTVEEVAAIVARSREEGLIEDEPGLLTGALEFSDATAGSVMVPPDRLVSVPLGCTPDEVERAVARTGFSRFPVVDGEGASVGYLHVKDVLYAQGEARYEPVPPARVRTLAVVRPDAEVEDALAVMQRSGAHLASVRADGAEVGVLFLEDIIEELVGEVRDAMQRFRPQ